MVESINTTIGRCCRAKDQNDLAKVSSLPPHPRPHLHTTHYTLHTTHYTHTCTYTTHTHTYAHMCARGRRRDCLSGAIEIVAPIVLRCSASCVYFLC